METGKLLCNNDDIIKRRFHSMKRKTLALLLAAALVLTTSACGNADTSNPGSKESGPSSGTPDAAPESGGSTADSQSDATASPAAEDGGYLKVFDGITYTTIVGTSSGDVMPEGQTVEDNYWTRWFTNLTGLVPEVIWSASGSAYGQKMNMMIASGDIPDYFEVSYSQYEALVKADLLADLTEYYDTVLDPRWRELWASADDADLKAVTKNGRIYGIPKANGLGDSNPLLWVRKDWLDKLNLEEPACIGDIAEIAKAFMTQDPDANGQDDTYGLPILTSFNAAYGGTGSVGDIFTNYGAAPGQWVEQDGSIVYGSLMPEAEETLELLNAWYQEGIIPKDFGSWTGDMYKQAVTGSKAGMFFGPWWLSWSYLTDTVLNDPAAEWAAYALPRESGENYIGGAPNAAGYSIGVVSKNCEDPSIFFYALNNLIHGMTLDSYKTELETAPIENIYIPMSVYPLPADAIIMTGLLATQYAAGEITLEEVGELSCPSEAVYNQAMAQAAKVVADSADPYDSMADWSNSMGYTVGMMALYNANVEYVRSVYSGTTSTMEKRKTFLDKLELEAYTKMVMGDTDGKSISQYFDEFVTQYLEQGGQDITEEVQQAVDAS